MIISTQELKDPVEFLNFLSSWNNELKGYVFRGHSSESYQLSPSILRDENRYLSDYPFGIKTQDVTGKNSNSELLQIQTEFTLLRDFYKLADRHGLKVPMSEHLRKFIAGNMDMRFMLELKAGDKWIPPFLQETAALAQHYGVPTRLLDWSYDPFVAAHFALKGAIGRKDNLVIWCLNAVKVTEEVNFDNAFPLKIITPPYYDNQNLSAQKGLFTHIETEVSSRRLFKEGLKVDRTPLNEFIKKLPSNTLYSDKDFLIKIIFPCELAVETFELLESHGYGEARIYPGYNGIAKQVMRKRKPSSSLENQ